MLTFHRLITARLIVTQIIVIVIFGIIQGQVVGYDLFEGNSCRLKDGSLGVCTKFPDCQSLYYGVIRRRIPYSDVVRCSFIGTTEVVCCGDRKPEITRPTTTKFPKNNKIIFTKNFRDNNDIYPSTDDRGTPDPLLEKKGTGSRGSGGKADVACSQYKKEKQTALKYNILEGTNTTLGEFPHMAALGYPSTAAGKDVEWNCGGSLISDRFVMTAAHCINDNGPTVIRLGKITIDSAMDGADPIDMDVNEVILHPMYKNSRQYDDIALIRLSEPVEFGGFVWPACLNTDQKNIPPDTVVVVTGWGLISLTARTKSHILLKANLTTVDLAECNQTHADYHRNRKLPQGLNQGHLCAYDRELKKDTCEGDSGGPLQIIDRSGLSIVYGVTSFGISCASMIPAVYARVSSYIDWIEPIVWP